MARSQFRQAGINIQDLPVENSTEPEHYLPVKKFRFTITIRTLTVLPPYKGGVFRGAFGNSFRKAVCALKKIQDCTACILKQQCIYMAVFNPPPPKDFSDAAKYRHAPPPYILNPPIDNREVFRPGDSMTFNLVLMGKAADAVPYFIYSFIEMGKRGLGRERGKYELEKVEVLNDNQYTQIYDSETGTLKDFTLGSCTSPHTGYSNVNNLILKFLTPLRLKEKNSLVTDLNFTLFFKRLAHRLELLSAFYSSDGPIPFSDNLIEQAGEIKVKQDNLYWYEWERYSSRQKDLMKLGGLRGEIEFESNLTPFMPYLKLGEVVNVGQGTSFGLGRYNIQVASPYNFGGESI